MVDDIAQPTNNRPKQNWSKEDLTRYAKRSGLSLLGLLLLNLLSKSDIFARCAERGFNESDSSCYGQGTGFFVLSVFRLVFAILPVIFMILVFVNAKKAGKERVKATLPCIIVSIVFAVVAVAYFIGILHGVV